MRATWITSTVSGVILGTVIHVSESQHGKADMAVVLPVLFAVALVGVAGVDQFREMRAERRKRGLGLFGIMAEPEDFSRFYFPAWGRMFLCFGATAAAIFSLKTSVL